MSTGVDRFRRGGRFEVVEDKVQRPLCQDGDRYQSQRLAGDSPIRIADAFLHAHGSSSCGPLSGRLPFAPGSGPPICLLGLQEGVDLLLKTGYGWTPWIVMVSDPDASGRSTSSIATTLVCAPPLNSVPAPKSQAHHFSPTDVRLMPQDEASRSRTKRSGPGVSATST